MKWVCAVIVTEIFLLFANIAVHSQSIVRAPKPSIIEPYYLQITFNKTTILIFPYSIKSVDRGSRDILTQKAKGVENVLLVKAGKKNFMESNLSVITSNGNLYSFIVTYSPNPSPLNIAFTKDTLIREATTFSLQGHNEAEWQILAKRIAGEKGTLYGVKARIFKTQFRLSGLYVKNDKMFFQLEIKNCSNVLFDIDMLRFFIRDGQRAKRTASQELELQPLYVYGDTSVINGQSENKLVFMLPKFTIPDKKYLSIQLMERNGGRHLHLKVQNRTLVKTKTIEE